jgi:predicted aspartyl protease
MKFPYSNAYFPPAPVLLISLAVPEASSHIGPYSALIDTGADGTFVPTSLLEQLNVPIVYATNVRSHLSERLHRVSVYKVDLLINSIRLPNIEVVGDDRTNNEIIIGRNVLNKLEILLHGPKQVTNLK